MKIKILSYNIHKGFTIGNRDYILEQIRIALRQTGADILFLQEVIGGHHDKKHLIPDWKTAIQFEYLADSVWPHFAYGKNAIYPDGHHGNAILSRFPIKHWENFNISTNRFEQRGLLKATITIPGTDKEIDLANTHLDLTQKGRNKQVTRIIEKTQTNSNRPLILVGDFNDWNRKISFQLEKYLGVHEVFKAMHGSYPLTFPSFYPMLPLDRIFIKNLYPLEAQILNDPHWRNLSDHLPLYSVIEVY